MAENRWLIWTLITATYATGFAGAIIAGASASAVVSVLMALLLPSTAAVIYLSATTILSRDSSIGVNRALATTYSHILSAVILFVLALQIAIVAALTALPPASWLPRIPVVLFGALGVAVGNLLPRTRPNLVFGIRTARTLSDRDEWIKTHRIAGNVAVTLGLLFVVGGMFLSKPYVESILGSASFAAAFLLAAAHLLPGRAPAPSNER